MTTTETTPSSTPAATTSETPAATTPAATTAETPSASASTDLGAETPAATAGESATTALGDEGEPELNEDGTPKEKPAEDPYKDFRGPPPEGKFEAFTLPDGAVADEELTNEFAPLAAELGLSQAGAQKLVDFKAKLDAVQIKRWGDHLGELKSQAMADPEIGGAKYKGEVAVALSAVKKFGGPALQKVLNQYGVGAHPEMIRAFAKIGKAMGETPGLTTGGGSGVVTEKPLHELMYGDSAKT